MTKAVCHLKSSQLGHTSAKLKPYEADTKRSVYKVISGKRGNGSNVYFLWSELSGDKEQENGNPLLESRRLQLFCLPL